MGVKSKENTMERGVKSFPADQHGFHFRTKVPCPGNITTEMNPPSIKGLKLSLLNMCII